MLGVAIGQVYGISVGPLLFLWNLWYISRAVVTSVRLLAISTSDVCT